MQKPPVHIIIVNYRGWRDTVDCLASLFRSTYQEFTVFVVDNHSGNGSAEQIAGYLRNTAQRPFLAYSGRSFSAQKDFHPQAGTVYIISNESNTGFAAANNQVLQQLLYSESLVWLLNPDMVVSEKSLEQLVQSYLQQQKPVIAGARIYTYTANPELLFYGGGTVNPYTATISPVRIPGKTGPDYISGACLFTHTTVFRAVGLLPENYFLYWEETDWCHKAMRLGIPLAVCSEAVCYDKISTTIGRGFLADYYYTRNGLYFIRKYAPGKTGFVLFFVLIRFCKRLLRGQIQRARGVMKGLIDFIKGKTHALQ